MTQELNPTQAFSFAAKKRGSNPLHERALKLAESSFSLDKNHQIPCIIFHLNQQRYAMEDKYIREVHVFKDLTPLPDVPNFIAGIIQLRRKVLSVLNLKRILHIAESERVATAKLLILANESMEFAIIVDDIEGTMSISEHDLQISVSTLPTSHQRFFKGMTPDRLIVLDGNKLLNDPSLIVQDY